MSTFGRSPTVVARIANSEVSDPLSARRPSYPYPSARSGARERIFEKRRLYSLLKRIAHFNAYYAYCVYYPRIFSYAITVRSCGAQIRRSRAFVRDRNIILRDFCALPTYTRFILRTVQSAAADDSRRRR